MTMTIDPGKLRDRLRAVVRPVGGGAATGHAPPSGLLADRPVMEPQVAGALQMVLGGEWRTRESARSFVVTRRFDAEARYGRSRVGEFASCVEAAQHGASLLSTGLPTLPFVFFDSGDHRPEWWRGDACISGRLRVVRAGWGVCHRAAPDDRLCRRAVDVDAGRRGSWPGGCAGHLQRQVLRCSRHGHAVPVSSTDAALRTDSLRWTCCIPRVVSGAGDRIWDVRSSHSSSSCSVRTGWAMSPVWKSPRATFSSCGRATRSRWQTCSNTTGWTCCRWRV